MSSLKSNPRENDEASLSIVTQVKTKPCLESSSNKEVLAAVQLFFLQNYLGLMDVRGGDLSNLRERPGIGEREGPRIEEAVFGGNGIGELKGRSPILRTLQPNNNVICRMCFRISLSRLNKESVHEVTAGPSGK